MERMKGFLKKSKIVASGIAVMLLIGLTGCAHQHEFSSATCTEPKTCVSCGETEGTPLGHTVEIGTCERCGEQQNYDLVAEIDSDIKSAENSTNIALYMITSGTDASTIYYLIQEGFQYYQEAGKLYEEAYNLCGDYDALSTVKNDIADVYNKLPLSISGGTQEAAVSAYLEQLTVFVTAQAQLSVSMLDIMALY